MRKTRRIKRMGRSRGKLAGLNLTPLMDVFTILVFFLLVNSGSVEIMEAPKDVMLPEAQIESKPRETVVIFVSPEEIRVQGDFVASVADILDGKTEQLGNITDRLAVLKDSIIGTSTETVAATQEVTILADKSVPFTVIKQIMSTCTDEGYENVSLAVIQKASQVQVAVR